MILRQYLVLVISLGLFFSCLYFLSGELDTVSQHVEALQAKTLACVLIAFTWWWLLPSKELVGWGLGKEKKAFKWFSWVLLFLAVAGAFLFALLWKQYGAPHFNMARSKGADLYLLLAHIAVVAPLLEEMIFRGVLQGSMERGYGRGGAAIIVAIAFALLHMNGLTVPTIVLGSVTMCFLRYKTSVLWPCVLIHMLGNGAVFFMSHVLKFGNM